MRGSGSGPKKWSANDRWLLARMTGPRRGTFRRPRDQGRNTSFSADAQRVLSYPVEHAYIVPRPLKSVGLCKGVVNITGGRAAADAAPFAADGGPVGVLVLHGFTGSPRTVRPWAEHLAAAGLTVRAPLLARARRRTWQELAKTGLDGLVRDRRAGVHGALRPLRPGVRRRASRWAAAWRLRLAETQGDAGQRPRRGEPVAGRATTR